MKILIIEDEPNTAADLASTIQRIEPNAEILDKLDSVSRSVRYLQEKPMPDLIYMDIQLADSLSFDIFSQVRITCPVIFCTAYDEYAINAFKMNGVDFILKPFDNEAIALSLEKINILRTHFQKENQYASLIENLIESIKPSIKSCFLVNHKGKMIPVATADVACFSFPTNLLSCLLSTNKNILLTIHWTNSNGWSIPDNFTG